jgi:hypothetical protein
MQRATFVWRAVFGRFCEIVIRSGRAVWGDFGLKSLITRREAVQVRVSVQLASNDAILLKKSWIGFWVQGFY